MSKLEKLSFNDVLKWHALAAGPAGLVLVMLPHRLFAQLSGAPYSPAAHEVARCYGALTAAQAWFAWRTRRIADGRVRRMLAEAYALCYALTGLALGRAMAAAPVGALGALACVASWALALLARTSASSADDPRAARVRGGRATVIISSGLVVVV